ncbi:MAG: SRPBCC family protein [Pseudomonadota bacterium]
MATIHREIEIACDLAKAWRELRDFSSASRLFAGVLTDCREQAGLRTVTFADGVVVQEQLIAVDEDRHRIAYAVVNGSFAHHGASMQLTPSGDKVTFVWTTDFLPDEIKPRIQALVDAGCAAIKRNLEARAPQ